MFKVYHAVECDLCGKERISEERYKFPPGYKYFNCGGVRHSCGECTGVLAKYSLLLADKLEKSKIIVSKTILDALIQPG